MPVLAIASIAGSVVSGVSKSRAAKKAAKAQQAAAIAEKEQFEVTRADALPFLEEGQKAVRQLGEYTSNESYQQYLDSLDPQNFQETPYYNFLREEGIRSRDRSASAKGNLLSGGQQREIERFGQGLASTEYGNYFERQRALRGGRINELGLTSGRGQTAGLELGRIGAGTYQSIGDRTVGAGNARAAGILGVGKSINSGINAWFRRDE
jgi:hypothetical protein